MTSLHREKLLALSTLAAFAVSAWLFSRGVMPASALVSGSPCSGNVCTGTITVGGQLIGYSYTHHVSPNGEFRLRVNGGVYDTSGLISFIVYDLPAFASWDKLANPNGAVYLPNEDVNPGRTAYERYDNDGCAECTVDQVMSVRYSGLSEGVYTFNLAFAQFGEGAVRRDLQFYVDAAAPSNMDESAVWAAVTGMDLPCADGVDNDLDYGADCSDGRPSGPFQCAGSVGDESGAVCEMPESTCNDRFDNDADGRADCRDQDCNGLVGEPDGSARCQYGNETGAPSCTDNFDNDADGLADCVDNLYNAAAGGTVDTICWKKPAGGCPAVENCATFQDDDKDKSYDDDWDDSGLTGVNCQDYDCFGNAACPAKENKTAANADADEQCFNAVDDDLDHLKNCADPDCIGVINPLNTNQICLDREFDLGQGFQFCSNAFDDDGDGPKDCADADCSRRFGNCGPCPAREDYTFDACADTKDNDTDVTADCADPDCTGDLGRLQHAARCAATENTNELCGDRFDNDLDGVSDCGDPDCAGSLGPRNQSCQPAGESACGDTFDNDGDGLRDCADPHCFGVPSCAAKDWTESTCQVVPRSTNPTPFASYDPTVTASVTVATHVNATDEIRLVGTGTYSSVTVVIGDNTDVTRYYPYADAGCTLIDNDTSIASTELSFVAIAGHAVQIFNTNPGNISGFDVTFSCATPAVLGVDNTYTYPVAILMQRQPGGGGERGEVEFTTTLYEAGPPIVSETEPEGVSGADIVTPYPGIILAPARRFRGIPSDPGVPPESSGICRCVVNFSGEDHSTGPDCMTPPIEFTEDASISVSTRAEDGAGNLGAFSAAQPFNVNVVPTPSLALAVSPSKPFFRTGAMESRVVAEFLTGETDFFSPVCSLYMRDQSGTPVGGGPITFAPVGLAANWIRCDASPALPSASDGTYYLTIRVTDNDGNSVESNRRVAYVCNDVPRAGDPDPGNGCAYADFDRDGAAEGLYTDLYSTAFKACDNCVGLPNSGQEDTNANGVGDECEPGDLTYGRCEIDTEIVCSFDSDDSDNGCPPGLLCCPGPSLGIDYANDLDPVEPRFQPKDPQYCKDAWGLCTLGGQVCFEDSDCPGGPGQCSDGSECWLDQNCVDRGLDPPTCTGADRCENLLHPWLQTIYGNIFSKKKITAPEPPPQSKFNATFCIVAKETIYNFESELCGPPYGGRDASIRYERPKGGAGGNNFSTVLGRIDIAGLRAGRYGQVISVDVSSDPRLLDTVLSSYSDRLGGRVFRVTGGDALIGSHTIYNDAKGNGTIFGDGVNIRIEGDVTYESATVTDLKQLASLGWIVIDDGSNTKGNIYIKGSVSNVVGAFFSSGDDGIRSVYPEELDSPTPLTVYGLMLARKFTLSRSFKSLDQGSERIIYDGRSVVNPPPGFGDVSKSLPLFSDALPQ